MPYKSSTYQKALNKLKKRHDDAQMQFDNKQIMISKDIPEINEINKQLNTIGLSIAKLFFVKDNIEELEKLKTKSLKLQDEKRKLLLANGYDENAFAFQYVCPYCKDTGFINDRKCKCFTEMLKSVEREEIEKCAPLGRSTFETFNLKYYPDDPDENGVSMHHRAEQIYDYCRQYAETFYKNSNNLLLLGGTGLGKTHLSLAIANVAINKGYSVTFGTCQNILFDLQNEKYGREVKTYDEETVLNSDLLVIDDLGAEMASSNSFPILFNIINTRILKNIPTVANTNLGFSELENLYGQRMTSRLAGDYYPLTIEGVDIRFSKTRYI